MTNTAEVFYAFSKLVYSARREENAALLSLELDGGSQHGDLETTSATGAAAPEVAPTSATGAAALEEGATSDSGAEPAVTSKKKLKKTTQQK